MKQSYKIVISMGVMVLVPVVLAWERNFSTNGGLRRGVSSGNPESGEAEQGLQEEAVGQVSTAPSGAAGGLISGTESGLVDTGDVVSEGARGDSEGVAAETESVAVMVRGLRAAEGSLHVAVFEGAAGFPNAAMAAEKVSVPVSGADMELSLALDTGNPVAIAVFQDLDGNGELSKNGLGIPTEPYGFSNNARGTFGPPRFEKAQVSVTGELKTLEIRVR